ncbi:copper radical oxidase [Amanita thiersii Skay4041]|uniref:Copper radical oxidase n=1 Tax=Amanita thiersii Skay4041 TaxID=703135 RepID=A0A2A9NM56_9AGAR|nr:copper radical oxidase [Amanita thiersii Skay4041]
MLLIPLSLLVTWLASIASPTLAATAGSFADGGDTQISAMMMFLGNEQKVYILDKAEGNAAQVAGHPAWGAVWDINTHQAETMDVKTNVFCASGMHLPNGSWVTFGGNGAVGRGGKIGSQLNPDGYSASWDSEYQDFDGAKAIRLLNPCSDSDNFNSAKCQWFDDPTVLSMQRRRWYSSAEPLGDGSLVIIGGFVNGGYINRNYPNTDPQFEGGAAENTFEFFPSKGDAQPFQFLVKTSGLNAYVHTFLMSSGKLFVQANVSTVLWDAASNQETPLPDMPHNVVRVYPASGAVAMLPLVPENNYQQTILFCGGTDMPDEAWGDYAKPAINTWEYPASKDCQRITPEPANGSPAYEQDDDMLEGRTMGQFIILPDGKLLVVNGGLNGTAGYSQSTGQTLTYGEMPFGESLASGPVGTPALYDPKAPKGQRWSNAGFQTSNIARLYHSSALLLPDGSVMIAGSNPNVDVNLTTVFPTTYKAEIFYPPYFKASTRPVVTGVPKTISYGGDPFDLTISSDSYSGSANEAAESATVVLQRGGFTTHAMNMGQRLLQLNNTFTVHDDGSITLHVAQAPPNSNIFQPGPALLFVTIHGIPSNGTLLIVGNGQMGAQPVLAASVLPDSVRSATATGSANGSNPSNTNNNTNSASSSHTGAIIGGVVAAIAGIAIIGALIGIVLARRRREAGRASVPLMGHSGLPGAASALGPRGMRNSDSSAFVPLQQDNSSHAWNASSVSLTSPYRDDLGTGARSSGMGMSMEYDPYASTPMQPAHSQQRF